jgi:hypothetical protein
MYLFETPFEMYPKRRVLFAHILHVLNNLQLTDSRLLSIVN